jgi:hypothetical protein
VEPVSGRPNNTECVMPMKSGHVIRVVGLDDPDALRGSGLWFFLGDEWDDAKPVILPEIIRPMLGTCNGHAMFIGTPKGFAELYKGYCQGQQGLPAAGRSALPGSPAGPPARSQIVEVRQRAPFVRRAHVPPGVPGFL